MASKCAICEHPRRGDIERAIASGEHVAIEVGGGPVTKAAMRRHSGHPAAAPAPPPSPAPLPPPAPPVEPPRAAEDLAAKVQRMLDEGAPLGRVYEVAYRAAAGHLVLGMSNDHQRAWSTLSRLLRQGREAEAATIERHPEFVGLIEDLVTAIVEELGPDAPEGIEGRIADRLEALQGARASSQRRAA